MKDEIDRLEELLVKIGTSSGSSYAELIDVAADVVGVYRKKVDPQIVLTPAELKALDRDTVVLGGTGDMYPAREYMESSRHQRKYYENDLPAVVVASGEHVRKCREALEEA